MQKATWDNPNKMHIESEYKTFNKQTNYIGTGKVIANTQFSTFVRPFTETKCNGHDFQEGYLQNYDLNNISTSQSVKDWIVRKMDNATKSFIFYNFFIYTNGQKKDIGYVLTDYEHNFVDFKVVYSGNFSKKVSAIKEAIKYICN